MIVDKVRDIIKSRLVEIFRKNIFDKVPSIAESVEFDYTNTDEYPFSVGYSIERIKVDGHQLWNEWPESFNEYFSDEDGWKSERLVCCLFDDDEFERLFGIFVSYVNLDFGISKKGYGLYGAVTFHKNGDMTIVSRKDHQT